MEKLIIDYERIKNILDVCNLDELNSLDITLNYVKRYDLKEINNAFINIKRKKSEIIKDEYEGINEYDDITKSHYFNIKEIPEYTINPYELIFLKRIIEDAIRNIKNENTIATRILPNMNECLDIINKKLLVLDDLSNIITNEELEIFFKKLNISEIEMLNEILEYIESYNIDRIFIIEKKALEENKIEFEKNEKQNINIFNKIKSFNDTELSFLSTILDDAMIGLFDYIDENNKHNDEKFTKLNYLFSNIQEAVEEEIINRKKEKKLIKIK